jgi:hypothetical protein
MRANGYIYPREGMNGDAAFGLQVWIGMGQHNID